MQELGEFRGLTCMIFRDLTLGLSDKEIQEKRRKIGILDKDKSLTFPIYSKILLICSMKELAKK